MEQRLSLVTLGVADLEAAKAFYERLGWHASARFTEGVAFFQCGGMIVSLYPFAALAKDADADVEKSGNAAVTLAYNARSRQDVDRILAEAEAAGARIAKPAEEAFWGGYSGYFRDPDGHYWEVAHNPGFTIDDTGAIHLPA
ncbi:MAG TPA: VOC family protein [Devosiaceae bacterium]